MPKKIRQVILGIALLAVFALGGYYIGTKMSSGIETAIPKEQVDTSAAPDTSDLPKNDMGMEPEPGASVTYVTKSEVSAAASGTWTEVTSYTADFTNDGTDDIIHVYTSATEQDGEIAWDDTQNWIVELETPSGEYYTFLNQSISTGSAYINVSETPAHTKTLSVITTGAGMTVKQYTYSSSGFAEDVLTDSVGENTIFSSVPNYG